MAGPLRSFLDLSAAHPFPLHNLPFSAGIPLGQASPRCVSRLGDFIIDLGAMEQRGLFADILQEQVFGRETLNVYMAKGRGIWRAVRARLQALFSAENATIRDNEDLKKAVLSPVSDFKYSMPVNIPNYTDFYASKNHAYNVGVMFRGPENALQPNWTRLPVGYHGRASSVRLSGTPVIRPKGQVKPPDAPDSLYRPCSRLDFELEVGFFVGGPGNELGHPMTVAEAKEAIFGCVLLNDWSARDIQNWEYVPLGPFTSKNFITTISPWIVTLEALEPFKVPLPPQEPEPLEYLRDMELGAYDVKLKVKLRTGEMEEGAVISESNLKYLYWSFGQQLAHHTVSGCNMLPGDLLGTGTISGTTPQSLGCLLEMSQNGKQSLTLPNGQTRTFLQDGDELTLEGECLGEGYVVGFGQCSSVVRPALP